MAVQRGRCKNYGGCRYADDRKVVEADDASFVCPGCGCPLTPETPNRKTPAWSGQGRRSLLIGGSLVLAALAGGGAWRALVRPDPSPRGLSLDEWITGDPPTAEIDAIRGSMAERASRIAALKTEGKTIGTEHGLLNPVPGTDLSREDLSLVDHENRDRRALYAFVATRVDPPVSYERVANAFAMRRWREWPRH